MLKKLLIIVSILPVMLLAKNNMVSLNINSSDIEIGYEKSKQISKSSRLYFGGEYLDAEDEFDKSQTQFSGHIKVIGNTPLRGLAAGIGFRGVIADIDSKSSYTPIAIPVQAGVIYTLPLALKSHVSGFYSYAPSSLCLSDSEEFKELRIEAAIEPIEGGMVAVGYRKINYELEKGAEYELNKSVYVGFRLYF